MGPEGCGMGFFYAEQKTQSEQSMVTSPVRNESVTWNKGDFPYKGTTQVQKTASMLLNASSICSPMEIITILGFAVLYLFLAADEKK